MAKTEITGEANPMKLPWPSDYTGMCQKLQREGCRSIGRMAGDDQNLVRVIDTLKILAAHAKVKLAEQKVAALVAGAAAITLRDKMVLETADRILRQEQALEGQIKGLGKRLEGLRARKA